MKKTLILALTFALALQTATAQNLDTRRDESRQGRSIWWKISAVALAAATTIDAHSSYGRLEANPLLRNSSGRFGGQGIALKALVLGGTVGAQYLLLRNHPKAEKFGVITNFALAGVLGGVAVSNYQRAGRVQPGTIAQPLSLPTTAITR